MEERSLEMTEVSREVEEGDGDKLSITKKSKICMNIRQI